MKKNRMLRLASALLVSVLLTTSVISGTFAKYVTTADASDSARVAKWGVQITANGTTFAASYKNDAAIGTTSAGDGESVKTNAASTHLVAPGTKGELASAAISGTPEVAVHVEYKPTLTLENWTSNGTDVYCPLIIKVTKGGSATTYGITGMKDSDGVAPSVSCTDIADLKSKVEAAIGGFSKDYAPNTDLATATADAANGVKVSWEWAFDENNDAKDTALGNAGLNGDTRTPATVALTIETSVTQIN